MAPKQALDKLAWQWAEQTNPGNISWKNVQTAYRTIFPHCPVASNGFCRKNCKGNPNCYNCLGERSWLEKDLDEELKEALIESAKVAQRTPGTFIGLKNLGATCYANTFLQVWFHNPEFRRGILDWKEEEKGHINSCFDFTQGSDENSLIPTSVVEHLQHLFALLSFSNRPFIDPSSFIQCLQLDTSLQQDAQEFSKLFISLLEDQLPAKDCYQGLNLIQHQFVGCYEYVTRCSGCGQQSRSRSKFYEIDLNIKGHTNLAECLQEFLQEEKLDGENQYYCTFCMKKQDAVRRIHLLDLPPTLNFQLLRFVFDRQTQNKKKLASYLQFPETLDMNEYMSHNGGSTLQNQKDLVYDLVSVLIHRGPGAHSGHYVAVIKDCSTNATYRFNDEEVEKLADDRFRLETEEDTDGNKSSQKKPRPSKGYLCSRNAYMLVYRRRSNGTGNHSPEITFESLSPYVRSLLEMDNHKHEESLIEQLESKKLYLDQEKEKQDMVKEFYNLLQKVADVERDDSFEWVSTAWLQNWLAADVMVTVPPIDNVPLLCQHEKIHPDNVCLTKLVPKAAADLIFEKFQGCLRLPCDSSACRQCVEEKCRIIHSKVMISEDNKLISQVLKSKERVQECDNNYWVGKKSLRNWRRMAEVALKLTSPSQKEDGEQENEPEEGNKDLTGDTSDKENHTVVGSSLKDEKAETGNSCNAGDASHPEACSTDVSQAAGVVDAEMDEEDSWSFNEDLLCSLHGNLTPDMSARRLIPETTWLLLKKYFPKAPEFRGFSPVCYFCQTQDEQEKMFKQQDKATAVEQRHKLLDLYLDRRRPSWSLPDVVMLNIISFNFLEEWRRFIKDPLRHPITSTTDNASLLCNHGRFMYDVTSCELLNEKYVYIWPHEWTTLTKYIKYDIEITVTKCHDPVNTQQLVVDPEFCQRCCQERREEEYSSQFTYTNKTIYVRKVTEETRKLFTRTLKLTGETSTDGDVVLEESDDMNVANENGKRKNNEGGAGEKMLRLEMPSSMANIRRSSRQGRIHSEFKLDVSSTQTLKDLKLQLVKAFSVMKMDQHLYFNGVELHDEKATLEQLKILPDSILYLEADEPSCETTFMDSSPVHSVEEGFKGTSLVGR